MNETPAEEPAATSEDFLDRAPHDLWQGEPVSATGTRIGNALYREEIHTIRELLWWPARDLLGIRGLGPDSVAEVQRVLAKHGLSLPGESL